MRKLIILAFCVTLFSYGNLTFAKGRGINADPNSLEYVCALSGGQWFGVEGGYWSCCWSNWGCLQCEPDGTCEMVCDNFDCRDANGQVRADQPPKKGLKVLKSLLPGNAGVVIPAKPKPFQVVPMTPMKNQIKNN